MQPGEGVSPTAVREILLLKALRHENLVRLTAIHLDRQARALPGAAGSWASALTAVLHACGHSSKPWASTLDGVLVGRCPSCSPSLMPQGRQGGTSACQGAVGAQVLTARCVALRAAAQGAQLTLAFQYAEHDLYDMLRELRDVRAPGLHPYAVKSLLWQMLAGLDALHAAGVMHRDLKPSNVLVEDTESAQGSVRIADFGLARCASVVASGNCAGQRHAVQALARAAPSCLADVRHAGPFLL